MNVSIEEESGQVEKVKWKMYFDGTSNALGHGIGAILISLHEDYYPFTAKLNFDYSNNIAEYEVYVLGLFAAIEKGIRTLQVFEDSTLVIY